MARGSALFESLRAHLQFRSRFFSFMPATASPRQLKHTRAIVLEAYARDDGLWDIEARLTDRKTRDLPLATGIRSAGDPIHDMTLCITINEDLEIVAASATSHAVPYPGYCESIAPDYGRLVGLNLLKRFRSAVRERFGGISGCTHITELAGVLPTVAVQAFAGEHKRALSKSERPFQLDHCHALRSDGDAVRLYYPRWYEARPSDDASSS
jgi:hypothetical protein